MKIPLLGTFVGLMNVCFVLVNAVAFAFFVGGIVDFFKYGEFPYFRRWYLAVWLGINVLWLASNHIAHPALRAILGVPVIALVSLVLFWCKVRYLRIYALIEGALALLVCGFTMTSYNDEVPVAQIGGVIASLYFLTRAADNSDKDAKDRLENPERYEPKEPQGLQLDDVLPGYRPPHERWFRFFHWG
jgi:hypothetical protein